MALVKLNHRALFCNSPTASVKRFLAAQAAPKLEDDYQEALPFSDIPRPKYFQHLRSFMPGGEFHDSSISDFALEMRKRLGDIFVMPGLFGRPDIVVSMNTTDIEKVFRSEGQWPIRVGFDSLVHYREEVRKDFFGDNKGLVATQGEEWGKMRTKINPILMHPKQVKSYLRPLVNVSNEFVKRIREIRHPDTLEVPTDFETEVNRMTFESICVIALNRELNLVRKGQDNEDALKLFSCVRNFFPLLYKLDLEPSMWKIVRTPAYYELMRLQDDIVEITHKMVSESLEKLEQKHMQGEGDDHFSVLEKLLKVDKKLGVIVAMDMLLAGVDATSVTLSGILLCLAKNPEKQVKLREEILKILPTKESELTEEMMKSLPYTRAVIKESMRYYPNVPGTFRTGVTDLTLSGYRIPKGTNVLAASNLMMRDEYFFPQPNEFLPERWLREDGKKLDIDPFSFLPFGFGPRSCAGKRIVDMELEIALINLLRNFNVEFNHNADKPFKMYFLSSVDIPLKFKFTDIKY